MPQLVLVLIDEVGLQSINSQGLWAQLGDVRINESASIAVRTVGRNGRTILTGQPPYALSNLTLPPVEGTYTQADVDAALALLYDHLAVVEDGSDPLQIWVFLLMAPQSQEHMRGDLQDFPGVRFAGAPVCASGMPIQLQPGPQKAPIASTAPPEPILPVPTGNDVITPSPGAKRARIAVAAVLVAVAAVVMVMILVTTGVVHGIWSTNSSDVKTSQSPTQSARTPTTTSQPVSCPNDTSKCSLGDRDLSIGSDGRDVSQLQVHLRDLGFYGRPIDGSFGPITQASLEAFQACLGLTPNGVADTDAQGTISKLLEATSESISTCFPSTSPPSTSPPSTSPPPTSPPPTTPGK